jgi:hypothetical protein
LPWTNTVRITSAAVVVVCLLLSAWVVLRLTQSLAARIGRPYPGFSRFGAFSAMSLVILRNLHGATAWCWWLAFPGGQLEPAGRQWPRQERGRRPHTVKVNIGIFAIWRSRLCCSITKPDCRHCQIRLLASSLLLPAALMRVHLNDPATQAYCGIVTLRWHGAVAAPPLSGRAFASPVLAAAAFAT